MKRAALALALASLSSIAAAAPPTANVNVTNPVLQVEVSNADPIPVAVAAEAARTPFFQRLSRNFGTTGDGTTLTIPKGKRAIFKSASGICVSSSPTFVFARLLIGNSEYVMYLAPQFTRTSGAANYYSFNHATDVDVPADANADREVKVAGLFAGAPVDGVCEAIVSGYFE
jgi:hypothetical protein